MVRNSTHLPYIPCELNWEVRNTLRVCIDQLLVYRTQLHLQNIWFCFLMQNEIMYWLHRCLIFLYSITHEAFCKKKQKEKEKSKAPQRCDLKAEVRWQLAWYLPLIALAPHDPLFLLASCTYTINYLSMKFQSIFIYLFFFYFIYISILSKSLWCFNMYISLCDE